ncbi:MAG TPA: hypothetical protein VFW78_03660 [Bacteroidia bacterium]|nr:hypothetical protein [Bacteroidia bacterium]
MNSQQALEAICNEANRQVDSNNWFSVEREIDGYKMMPGFENHECDEPDYRERIEDFNYTGKIFIAAPFINKLIEVPEELYDSADDIVAFSYWMQYVGNAIVESYRDIR